MVIHDHIGEQLHPVICSDVFEGPQYYFKVSGACKNRNPADNCRGYEIWNIRVHGKGLIPCPHSPIVMKQEVHSRRPVVPKPELGNEENPTFSNYRKYFGFRMGSYSHPLYDVWQH